MSLATKQTKAKNLGIVFDDNITEDKLDVLIEAKQTSLQESKTEEDLRVKKAEEERQKALKDKIVLRDVDGDEVDQADYFFPRRREETIDSKVYKATKDTAPKYFNASCGLPVEREELIEAFKLHFPVRKGFLFYKLKDKEVYLIIVPLMYATTINDSNESRPGDFQRHALSFISEGSVNVDSLKMKLARIAAHSSISREPLA